MRKFAFPALLTLLLLAIAAPSCLAAENSATDQQPAPQYSKLPPVQLPSTLYAQKVKSQPPSFFLLQRPKQADKEKSLDWIGITTAIGTIISSIAAIITAIAVPLITLDISKKTMKQTALSLEKDFKRRKIEQEKSFKFQRDQILFEEKKKLILKFYESTSIQSLDGVKFSIEDIRAQMTMLKIVMDKDFYENALSLFTFLDEHHRDYTSYAPSDTVRIRFTANYEPLHLAFADVIKRTLSGEDFDPTLTASK